MPRAELVSVITEQLSRLTDEIKTWSVAELVERSSKSNRQLLDEVITETAAHLYDIRGY